MTQSGATAPRKSTPALRCRALDIEQLRHGHLWCTSPLPIAVCTPGGGLNPTTPWGLGARTSLPWWACFPVAWLHRYCLSCRSGATAPWCAPCRYLGEPSARVCPGPSMFEATLWFARHRYRRLLVAVGKQGLGLPTLEASRRSEKAKFRALGVHIPAVPVADRARHDEPVLRQGAHAARRGGRPSDTLQENLGHVRWWFHRVDGFCWPCCLVRARVGPSFPGLPRFCGLGPPRLVAHRPQVKPPSLVTEV